MRRMFLITATFLAGCTDSEIKEAVKEGLVDPESARFGEISYSPSGDMACAEVNAKNRMGGYTGRKQIYLERGKDGWNYVRESEETHEECVDFMAYLERPKDESTTNPSQIDDSVAVQNLTAPGDEGVSIIAVEPVWVQVSDGGRTLFSGELDSGQQYWIPKSAADPRLKVAAPERIAVMVGVTQAPPLGPPGRAMTNVSLKPDDLLK